MAQGKRVPARDIILTSVDRRLSRVTGMPLQPMGTESAQHYSRLVDPSRMRLTVAKLSVPVNRPFAYPASELRAVEFYA
jgi:hypothetical protein